MKISFDDTPQALLKGRHPLDLPTTDIIKDIFLEIEDTGKFAVQYFHQTGKSFPICYHEALPSPLLFEESNFSNTMSVITKYVFVSQIKSTINVKWIGIDCDVNEAMNELRDTIERLKSCLGEDKLDVNWNSYMGLVSLETIAYQIS